MKHLLAIFFFFGCSLLCFSQEFDVRSFTSDPSDLSARKEVRRTVNDEPCALVKVLTNIKGMQFESNIGIVDVQHKEDGYWVYVAPRERRIRLMAPAFLPVDQDMPQPAIGLMVYSMVVAAKDLKTSPSSSSIDYVFILSEDGVSVSHNDGSPLIAPTKELRYNLVPGKHHFNFSKAGFESKTLEFEVEVAGSQMVVLNKNRDIEPAVKYGHLSIETIPDQANGATVWIDGSKSTYTTPCRIKLPEGRFEIRLEKKNFAPQTRNINIEADTEAALKLTLTNAMEVSLSSTPSGASVRINGSDAGTTPTTVLLGFGHNKLSFKKGMHKYTEKIFIEPGGKESFHLNFPVKIHLKTHPKSVEVYLNDELLGKTPLLTTLPSGKQELTFKPGKNENRPFKDDGKYSIVLHPEGDKSFKIDLLDYASLGNELYSRKKYRNAKKAYSKFIDSEYATPTQKIWAESRIKACKEENKKRWAPVISTTVLGGLILIAYIVVTDEDI